MVPALPEASAAVMPRMLAPAAPELVPITPMVPSPCLPITPCHWMPNSASLLALTSTIRLSTSTCARRPSSLSITARNWRYCGSGAVMMSELVVGSAWICPPVEGWLAGAALLLAPAPRPLLAEDVDVLLPVLLSPLPSAGALVLAVDGVLVLAPPALALPCRHGGAQSGGELGGVGVLQVHHMDVAAGSAAAGRGRLVEPFDQGTHLGHAGGVGGAQHQGVAARLGQQGGLGAGIALTGGGSGRAGAAARFHQPRHQRSEVGGNGVLERDDFHIAGGGHIHGRNDLAQALQVVGVVGDDQRVGPRAHVDGVVRADQRAQHGHQVGGAFVLRR
jgi:hypothetical protein